MGYLLLTAFFLLLAYVITGLSIMTVIELVCIGTLLILLLVGVVTNRAVRSVKQLSSRVLKCCIS
jgi:hypothetical protein